MSLRISAAAALAALATLFAAGCERSTATSDQSAGEASRALPAASHPNVVLVVVCTFRFDHMGEAGYSRHTTPFLDQMARDGVFFENAVSASSWTKPAAASILTGLTPNVHGMTDFYPTQDIVKRNFTPKRTLADGVETLAECFQAAGYATFARINNVHVSDFFNMTQGFDDCASRLEMDTQQMVADLGQWLRQLDTSRPFFALLFTRDPHITYLPRYEFYRKFDRSGELVPFSQYPHYAHDLYEQIKQSREGGATSVPADLQQRFIDLYDAELAQLDAALRRLPGILRDTGREQRTLFVVTADHGERFFEDGLATGHGNALDETVLRVPLVFAGQGVPRARRVNEVVRSIDVFPTLAELAGLKPPQVLQGHSLVSLWRDETAERPARSAFASFEENGFEHALRLRNYKLRQRIDGTRQLFDVAADAGEQHDLSAEQPEVVQQLEAELTRWLEQERALGQVVQRGDTRELSPEVLKQLRELGYIE